MRIQKYLTIVLVLLGLHAYSQTPTSAQLPAAVEDSAPKTDDSTKQELGKANIISPISGDSESAMQTPAPVSPVGYSMAPPSESSRRNYVNMGLNLMSGYDDNVASNTVGRPLSDNSYSVGAGLSWHQSTPRVLWNLGYSPGFTFYQHVSSLNTVDHNVLLDSTLRLSPHVTLLLRDGFSKSSNPIGQYYQSASSPEEITQPPVATVISPLADQISNSGSVQLTYQFGRNSMVGASGIFSILRYLNRNQVPGLFDSDTKAGQGFYAHRISSKHYVGMRYEFQDLLSKPNVANTQTHSLVLFYTFYLQPRMSVSLFAGPQHAETSGGAVITTNTWFPAYGGSFAWQGVRTSVAIDAARSISAGGGLQGATRSEGANGAMRRQLTKLFSAEVGASYSKAEVLVSDPRFSSGGHTVSGSMSLHRQIGEHLGLGLAYTRLYQGYDKIQALSSDPNRNRISLSLSYHFQRPIGR